MKRTILVSCLVATFAGPAGVAHAQTQQTQFVNISTRGHVLTGDSVMIGGFIIQGNGAKKVLIIARGPSLTALGVPGALANPFLTLYSGATPIDSNDTWQTRSNFTEIPTQLRPSDPNEAAILTTLNPGAYTAIVNGVGNTTGVALVEIFSVNDANYTSTAKMLTPRGTVWTFTYNVSGTTFNTKYRMTAIDNEPLSGLYYAYGDNEAAYPMTGYYRPADGQWIVFDPNRLFSFENYFTFTFSNDNTVSGCYHRILTPGSSTIGPCYPMTGTRAAGREATIEGSSGAAPEASEGTDGALEAFRTKWKKEY